MLRYKKGKGEYTKHNWNMSKEVDEIDKVEFPGED